MKNNRFDHGAVAIALLAGGATLCGAAVAAEALTEIKIEVSRETKVETKIEGRTSSGAAVEVISLSRRVGYSDLNLATHAGAMELERRVTEAAQGACKELDKLYPLTAKVGDSPACAKKAADAAMVQVHTAVAAAEKRP
jgi:UrcA family protein